MTQSFLTDTNITRSRDVVTIVKGTANPVVVDQHMIQGGWPGGQAVTWVDSPNDEFLVSYSDGTYGGFLLWGSNESSDQYTAWTKNQPLYGFAILCTGAWVIMTPTYEKYTYQSRQVGPLVLNSYTVGQRLTFSLRGYFTSQDEWTLSGDPRGSNNYFIGYVVQVPTADLKGYITIQTSI